MGLRKNKTTEVNTRPVFLLVNLTWAPVKSIHLEYILRYGIILWGKPPVPMKSIDYKRKLYLLLTRLGVFVVLFLKLINLSSNRT